MKVKKFIETFKNVKMNFKNAGKNFDGAEIYVVLAKDKELGYEMVASLEDVLYDAEKNLIVLYPSIAE